MGSGKKSIFKIAKKYKPKTSSAIKITRIVEDIENKLVKSMYMYDLEDIREEIRKIRSPYLLEVEEYLPVLEKRLIKSKIERKIKIIRKNPVFSLPDPDEIRNHIEELKKISKEPLRLDILSYEAWLRHVEKEMWIATAEFKIKAIKNKPDLCYKVEEAEEDIAKACRIKLKKFNSKISILKNRIPSLKRLVAEREKHQQ